MVAAWRCVTMSPDRLLSIHIEEFSRLLCPCPEDFIMAQNYMYVFRVRMETYDRIRMVLKALIDHGFRLQDIVASMSEQKVYVPVTKTVQEVLHIIGMTGQPAAYFGLRPKIKEVIHQRWHTYWP